MHKILVIDSAPQQTESILSMYGYAVDTETDGYTGLQTFLDPERHYDLVISEIHLPKLDGWDLIKAIRNGHKSPDVFILILAAQGDEPEFNVAALRRGADRFLAKPVVPSVLLANIEAMFRRFRWSKPTDPTESREPFDISKFKLLTRRELEILSYIVQGYSNQEISVQLVISETTVKNHLAHIFKKLNVSNRTQAAYMAQKLEAFRAEFAL